MRRERGEFEFTFGSTGRFVTPGRFGFVKEQHVLRPGCFVRRRRRPAKRRQPEQEVIG